MSSVYISRVGSHFEQFQLEITDGSEVEGSILMFAEMTPGSNHTLAISRAGIERNCCALYRQQKARPDNICYFSQSRQKDRNCTKPPSFKSRLKFCFKDRVRMEQREPTVDPAAEGIEGRLKELASKWFIDTQVPLIVNNGLFPTWFLGFITRRDAEEILRDKELGCFLIRLSDKAIGYILSYKGRDRCRHFVISQSETGKFVVCGDTEGHNTVPELVEYYKTSAIEPFGEYLTSSCFEAFNEELYDIIQVSPKDKPITALRTAKKLQKQQINSTTEQQPPRPQKSNRIREEVPPLPRRSRHLDSGALKDHDGVLYAQLSKQTPRETPRVQHISQENLPAAIPGKAERLTMRDPNDGRFSPPSGPESVYSQLSLLDSKSRSLPLLDTCSNGEQSYRLSVLPDTPPRLSPRPIRQAPSCTPRLEKTDLCSGSKSSHSHADCMNENTVYQLAGRVSSRSPTSFDNRLTPEQHADSVYAEVTHEAPTFAHDSTYELLPNHKERTKLKPNRNTYWPAEEFRGKNNPSSCGLKNDKWKWLFPEAKRKW
ncbi:uncharacterized protein PAE49_007616 [Odontesthes bonariensis]|uniref:uncharacterized protein LOC142384684 n=1 Tax=Odontesthes bonariensis TaxID=219752 RepID=UPI003F582762